MNRLKFNILPLVLSLILIQVLFQGCGSAEEKQHYKIGFSQCVGSDQWRITMLKEMRRELSFHPETEFFYQDAKGNSATQIAQVKSLLNKGIDLLIISPNEAQPLTPIVEEAYEKGIPVIVVDRKITSNKYTAYVGADNYEIGAMAGNYLGNKLSTKVSVIEILGLPRSSPAIERQRGFADALAKYPQVKIQHQYYGNWLKADAAQQVEQHLQQFENVNVVFAHNDQMALGVYQQLKKHNLHHHIKLIGVDALAAKNNGLDFVSNKILDASVLYPTGGKEAIRTAFSILAQKPFNKNNILKTLVVDSSNVQLMKMQEERMDSQQHDILRQQEMLAEQQKIYRSQRFTLNILVISLVLAVVFGGLAFYSLTENWKTNKKLEAQNREIIQSEQQLRQMTAKAAEANEAKIQFFTNVSHEFRTPITLMLLPIEELLKEANLSIHSKSKLLLLQKNAHRILKMVNELIDFRKIEYDKMHLNLGKVDMIALLNEVIQSFKDVAQKKYIDLKLVNSTKQLFAPIDIQLFDKVLFNLIGNAIKFTPNYGKIHISVSNNDDALTLLIEDSGVGMSIDEQDHAFEPFYQGKNVGVQGSGLGLALCKQIVELHNGTITLKSEKDKGTLCQIILPLKMDANLEHAEQQTAITEDERKLYTDNIITEKLQTFKEDTFLHDKSILIIEDNDDMRIFLQQHLSADYTILTAANGRAGFEQALNHIPDLIISDVLMPDTSGLEATRLLKNDLRTSHIPVVLLTARGSEEQKLEGLDTLADAYLTKPFNMDVLRATIKNVLLNRELLKQKFTSDVPIALSGEVSKLDKKFMNDLASIVEGNLSNENLSVEDISTEIGLSRIQLYRKAKALLDCSIAEYILNRRLQKAKYLLLNEHELSIAEITFQTGFTSPNYFATVFKSKYGLTPTEFKKKKAE